MAGDRVPWLFLLSLLYLWSPYLPFIALLRAAPVGKVCGLKKTPDLSYSWFPYSSHCSSLAGDTSHRHTAHRGRLGPITHAEALVPGLSLGYTQFLIIFPSSSLKYLQDLALFYVISVFDFQPEGTPLFSQPEVVYDASCFNDTVTCGISSCQRFGNERKVESSHSLHWLPHEESPWQAYALPDWNYIITSWCDWTFRKHLFTSATLKHEKPTAVSISFLPI